MGIKNIISSQTRNNWFVDLTLFLSAVITSLSGIYFLFLPVGGYQGGRNPAYGIEIFFERHTWEDVHNWIGLLMIITALVHVPLHWSWIVNMFNRMYKEIFNRGPYLKARGRLNLLLNTIVGISFLAVALSGLYFFFIPGASQDAGSRNWILIFSQLTWDMIHTWGGVIFISAAILHFAIHWRWIVKVTGKMPLILLNWLPALKSREIAQSTRAKNSM